MIAIMWKDFRSIVFHPRKILLVNAALIGMLIWIFGKKMNTLLSLDYSFIFLSLFVMFMNIYQLSLQVYDSERVNKTWEKLLCTNKIERVFFAKSLIVSLVTSGIVYIFCILFFIYQAQINVFSFSISHLAFLLLALPLICFALSELFGCIFAILGQVFIVKLIFIPLLLFSMTMLMEADKNPILGSTNQILLFVAYIAVICFALVLLSRLVPKSKVLNNN